MVDARACKDGGVVVLVSRHVLPLAAVVDKVEMNGAVAVVEAAADAVLAGEEGEEAGPRGAARCATVSCPRG